MKIEDRRNNKEVLAGDLRILDIIDCNNELYIVIGTDFQCSCSVRIMNIKTKIEAGLYPEDNVRKLDAVLVLE